MGIVVSSENRAGGQGKTTAVILLATALAHSYPYNDFLIINTDPQNDCALQLGIDDRVGDRCLSQFVLGERTLGDVAVAANSMSGMKRKNLYYIPAGPQFAAEVERMQEDYGVLKDMYDRLSEAARRRQAAPVSPSQQFLDALLPLKRRGPDVIFIDCPPSLGPLRQMVHWLADYVVVPVVPGAKEVGMTMRHTKDISEDIEAGASSKILAVVPNQFDTRLSLHREFLQQLHHVYNGLLWKPVPHRTAVGQAAANGYSIVETDPGNEVSSSYRLLAQKIARLAGLPAVDEEE